MSSIFLLKGVDYSYYGKDIALKNISLEIYKSECFAILGANGSGKSTLLKILDGLYFPKKGSVVAFDEPLSEKAFNNEGFKEFFRKKVGFVFQDPDSQLFLPTVKDEIAFAPMQIGYSKDKIKSLVSEIAKELGIEGILDKYPFRLSEGEKKKVAIASVYTLNPDVWLLDEPIFSLDPKSQWWIVDFLKELKIKKKTIVVATHNLGFAKMIADRCCVLNDNHEIAAIGDIESVLKNKSLLEESNLIHQSGVIA